MTPRGPTMTGDDRTRLLFGPYAAPPCLVGDRLVCERYGESVVAEMSGGPIPWPVCRAPGRPCLILSGDRMHRTLCTILAFRDGGKGGRAEKQEAVGAPGGKRTQRGRFRLAGRPAAAGGRNPSGTPAPPSPPIKLSRRGSGLPSGQARPAVPAVGHFRRMP